MTFQRTTLPSFVSLVLGLSLVAGSAWAVPPSVERRVMIIGIDGTRPDALRRVLSERSVAGDDWLQQLSAGSDNSGADWNLITGDISFSGPGWASMLTGVWCDKHRVISNEFVAPDFATYPPIFALMKEHDPTIKTASIANWDAINSKILTNDMTDFWFDLGSDDDVETTVVSMLESEDFDARAIFVHFDDVDHAGHACCYSADNENYLGALRSTAERLQRIRKVLEKRTRQNKREEWLVLYSTDHGGGGVIGSEHGPNTDEDRRTFLIGQAYNTDILFPMQSPATTPQGIRLKIVDIAASALSWLNVPLKPEWKLEGQNLVSTDPSVNPIDRYAERSIPECGLPRATWDTGHGRTAPLLRDKALPIH